MKTRTLSAALAGIISFLAAAVNAQLTVTTVINNGLREPYGVVVDALGNFYVCDSANNRIVRVDASTQAASTLAGIAGEAGSNDGPPDLAHFNSPQGLLTVSIGGVSGLLVADSGNNLIRFVRFSDGVVTSLAGQTAGGPAVNAAGSTATFRSPIGLVQDANGNVYIADWGNNTIRVVNLNDPAFGITNVVISGTSFNRPMAVAFAGTNQLWVADTGSQMIKLITLATPTNGNFTAWLGGDRLPGTNDASFGPNARFNSPSGLLWLSGVGLLISDTLNNSIRLATNYPAYGVTNYAVVTWAGTPGNGGLQDGSAATAKFNSPIGLAQDILYNGLLVADLKNNAVRRIQTGPPPAPVPPPAVGWVDFTTPPADVVSVLRTNSPFIFHNDVTIAIAGTAGAEIHFTWGPTGSSIPNPDPTTGGTPPFYQDGMFPNQVSPSIVPPQPDVTVKAIGFAPGRRSSDVVSARFQFKTANPVVSGNNAAMFTVTDQTDSAQMWYTIDGSDPTNAAPSLGPITSGASLSLNASFNLTFRICAFRANYLNSDIITTFFSPTNFVPNIFKSPLGIALDTSGAQLYIADALSNEVQVLHPGNNQTETFLDASLGILQPVDVVVDATNNVYVLNQGTGDNGSILQFDQFGNLLRTNAAGLAWPTALTVDNFGNVFVAEKGGAVQQFNSGSSNTLFTITNTGVQLQGIALFSDGTIALSDAGNHVIWQVNPVTYAVSLLTGTPGVPGTTLGAARFAKLNQPYRLARAAGNLLVAADSGNNRLVVVDRAGAITNVLNSANALVWYGGAEDPLASSGAQLIPMVSPVGVALGNDGGVYASEVVNKDIRKIPGTGLLPPPPLPYLHLFRSPLGIALDTSGAQLYIADALSNAVQVLHLGNNQTETFLDASKGILQPVDVVVDATNNVYVLNQGAGGDGSVLQFDQFGNLLGTNAAGLAMPTALAVDSFGNVFVAEEGGAVQQFNSGSSSTLVTITNAGVQLQGIALFSDGTIAVSDAGNHVIWQVNPVTRAVTLLTGTPGVPGTTLGAANFAKLNQPYRLARAAGNLLVAADYGNNRLVVVDRAGAITNVLNSTNASVWYGRSDDPQASSGTQFIPMVSPVGVALGSDGGVYASEVVNKDIRKIPGAGLLPPPPLPYLHLFRSPMGIAENWSGSKLYIADLGSSAVQVLHLDNNQTETFLDASAGILNPVDVVVDYGNHVHVLNQGTGGNGSVLEFNEIGNLLSTNASGLAMPTALVVDDSGNVFIAEQGGAVEQFNSGVSATLFTITNAGVQLEGIALFDDGAIAVSDAGNHVIWQFNPVTRAVTLLTGTPGVPGTTLGLASFAKLNQPYRLARAAGNLLVAADYGNNRLVVVDRGGSITNVLNSTNASVWYGRSDDPQASTETQLIPMVLPVGVVVGSDGGVYASEAAYYDIRKLINTGLASTPPPYFWSPLFNGPRGIALNTVGSLLYIADQTNNAIQALNLANNLTTNFLNANNGISQPVDIAVDSSNNLYVLNQSTPGNGSIMQFDRFGNLLGTIAAELASPTALKLDGYGNLFVAEQGGAIQQFSAGTSNNIATITNAGVQLQGIALFDDGTIAVSDAGNHVIWQVNPVTRAVTLLTGSLGVPGSTLGTTNFARLNQPQQLARAAGNLLVAADYGNNRLVVIDRSGAVTNVLNSTNALVWYGRTGDPHGNSDPQFAPMMSPVGVALNSAGEVFSSEALYNDIRKLLDTGLASTPPPDFPSPIFKGPRGIALNSVGSLLYIADQTNNAIQGLNLANNLTTTFLNANDGISQPVDVAVDISDSLYVLNRGTAGNGSIMEFDYFGNLLGTVATNLALPTALKLSGDGNLFVTEQGGAVQLFSYGSSNTVVTITNAGVQLQGIALFDDGTIAVSDAGNHVIWQVDPVTKAITLLTGTVGVPGSTLGAVGFAKLNQPHQLARAAGDLLVAADYGNNRLVVINRAGSITNVLNSTNAMVWYGRSGDPHGSSDPQFAPMVLPVGVALGSAGELFASEALYNDIRGLLGTGLSVPPPPPQVPAPQIGYVDFPATSTPVPYTSVFHPVSSFVLNNDASIVSLGTIGSQTFYTYGQTPTSGSIPDPTSASASAPVGYQDGMSASQVAYYSVAQILPDLTIKAIGEKPDGSPNSAIVQARFQFITANPILNGNNAAQFTVSDLTTNAEMWYTMDGSNPTNAAPSVGPIPSGTTLSLQFPPGASDLTFKVIAFRDHYQPSTVVPMVFSATNFIASTMSFGFASGEASSDFVGSPGQTFYAPVTLNPLPGTKIYSLQLNLTVTNAGPNPGPAVFPGAYGFQSFLVKKLEGSDATNAPILPGEGIYYYLPPSTVPQIYKTIPPYMYSAYAIDPPPTNQIRVYDGSPFVNMVFTNTALNLLGVGWLERIGQTNLYDTMLQTLISYSEPHDTLFTPDMGKVVVGGYGFQIPPSATNGQTYQIQIGRPSATADGVGAPGFDVYIATPTNGSLAAGAINSIKNVTVGQRKYVAGDSAPFRWFNAGDFGNTNLDNSDVMQVFQSAVYNLDDPLPGSDFYDSMDSCGGFGGLDLSTGCLTNSGPLTLAQQNALFDGNDTLINQIPFGNSPQVDLDVCDVYVTFRRSLDPSLTWYRRFWTNGVLEAEVYSQTNLQPHDYTPLQPKLSASFLTNPPSVNFAAADVTASAGQTLQIPIAAKIFGDYPLRVLMLNLSVEPLDGSPALSSPIQFKPNAALGTAAMSSSTGNGSYAATWLNSTIAGLTGTATLGTLILTIPANAPSSAAYAIHFDHASASPNGIASFPKKALTGLILLSDRSSSVFNDGIPDSWRLRYFGTVNNILSQAAADADGDGANNWQEYIAGTDPTDPKSVLRASTDQAAAQQSQECVVHWPSVAGKRYLIERSTSLYGPNWIPVSTNTGSGADMEFHDTEGGNVRFYRVHVIP
jgi:DNA-binding beta-propeller fold protein YncE